MKYLISYYDEQIKKDVYLTRLKDNQMCWNDFPNKALRFETIEKAKKYVFENYLMFKITKHEKVIVVGFEEKFLNNFDKEVLGNDNKAKN